MKRISIMKLSCTEAARVCNKAEYKEANFGEKLKLRLHLFFCKTCNDYHQNNHKLTSLIKKAEIKSCSAEQKEIFRQQIKNRNSKISK